MKQVCGSFTYTRLEMNTLTAKPSALNAFIYHMLSHKPVFAHFSTPEYATIGFFECVSHVLVNDKRDCLKPYLK
jgi:hypothetical protein